jgi:quercetin dioxygenase-like cupin family protein
MINGKLTPAITRKTLKNTYLYAGGTITILLTGAETAGVFSMWESVQKPGAEPPMHVHHTSDETFYVLEGKIRFFVGSEIIDAAAGDVVFGPRGIPHTFRIMTPAARALTVCTPSGVEELFRQLGEPTTSFDLPEEVRPLPDSAVPKLIALSKQLNIELVNRELNA